MQGGFAAEHRGIFVGSLDSTEQRKILPDLSGITLSNGMLLFVRDNTLVAQPLDTATGEPKGGIIPVAAGVAMTSNINYAPVTASDTGLLLFQTGGDSRGSQFVWVDRGGKQLETVGPPGTDSNPALSSDGKRLLFERATAGAIDTWVRDLTRGTDQRFITSPPLDNEMSRWSPGGDYVVFNKGRLSNHDLFLKTVSDGQEEPLVANSFNNIRRSGRGMDGSSSTHRTNLKPIATSGSFPW